MEEVIHIIHPYILQRPKVETKEKDLSINT
jgi:hypothetical protein